MINTVRLPKLSWRPLINLAAKKPASYFILMIRLTWIKEKGKKYQIGGMAEWFKAAVLKTANRKVRGFESYSLRQKFQPNYSER